MRLVKAFNDIPSQKEAVYREAIWREYRRRKF